VIGFVDPEHTRVVRGGGHWWRVGEATYPTSSDPVGRCLMFSCDSVIRLVRAYPADWHAQSESTLYEVSLSI
jgi:hypothetical protein